MNIRMEMNYIRRNACNYITLGIIIGQSHGTSQGSGTPSTSGIQMIVSSIKLLSSRFTITTTFVPSGGKTKFRFIT